MSARSSPKNSTSQDLSHGTTVKRDTQLHLTPLRTKLRVPPRRSGWISRSRLEKRLDKGFERKLTLISAPAGFGKTTLLVNWIDQHRMPAAEI